MFSFSSIDYVRDGDMYTGPLFGLFKSTLPLYFTISDIVHVCVVGHQMAPVFPRVTRSPRGQSRQMVRTNAIWIYDVRSETNIVVLFAKIR